MQNFIESSPYLGQKMIPEHHTALAGQQKGRERMEYGGDLLTVEVDATLCATRICAHALCP